MEVINQYLNYIKYKKNLSKNTIDSYYVDIKKYFNYLNSNGIDLKSVTENDIISYIIKLESNKISPSSISRNISSIKSFHEYLFFNHISMNNPAKTIKKPKVSKYDMNILSKEEIYLLLDFKMDNKKSIRDKAIFEILYGTGIKVSELVMLDIDDINLSLDYIHCKNTKIDRIIPITDVVRFYLKKYIKEARCEIAKEYEKALFVNSFGNRFTRQGLWKLIKKRAEYVNIKKNINPSMLRNSFAIHLLNEGANIAVVGKILGNSNLSSMQSYIEHIDNNIRKEIKDKHPRKTNKGGFFDESNLDDNR